MQIEDKRDLITAVAFFLLGAVVIVASGNIPVKNAGGDIGSAFLPQMIAGIMTLLSIILFVKTIVRSRKREKIKKEDTVQEKSGAITKKQGFYGNKAVFVSFLNLCVYVGLFKPLGFIISSILFLVLQMGIMTEDSKVTPKKIVLWIVLSAITAIAVYLIFYEVFSMPLPMGILEEDE